ncbi:hypothetical protein HCU40_19865 (plasmid) [Pseudanabaena biceps]|nr:hypothetical protein [Pseudanabaena biceps]
MLKSKKINLGWKQSNYRKIPSPILAKIRGVKNLPIVVACVKRISESDILRGKYLHLGITINDGKIDFPDSIIPKPNVGRYSKINVEGKEIPRKDLPKTIKLISHESPNYGDPAKGFHTVNVPREVYERDYIKPKEVEIKIEALREEVRGSANTFILKFGVNWVLNQGDANFDADLLYGLNLLQENVGAADVFRYNANLGEYLKTISIDWEILPIGNRDEVVRSILSRFKSPNKEIQSKLIQRYNLLMQLKPTAFISGTNGFRRYFGAKFDDNLVVFENLAYGNAIYVMFEQWEILSKMSRIELLAGKEQGFERIIHKSGWEDKLRKSVKQR